ncbi:hypothetical protein BASA81_013851 [Batrachochytrium salamandrivorans]|nr:hypothetical protein BASA81_013851 [Batrachochytrium salamandrivorans]
METPPPPPPPPPLLSSSKLHQPLLYSKTRKLEQDLSLLQFQNDSVALDFEKSRSQQEKQRAELDLLKEKLRKQKQEVELTKLEDQERNRGVHLEMEELKREAGLLQASRRQLELDLERAHTLQHEQAVGVGQGARTDAEQELRAQLIQAERFRTQHQQDLESAKRLAQTLRLDGLNESTKLTVQFEERMRERDLELDQAKKRLGGMDAMKKKFEVLVEELREANKQLELELQRERQLGQHEVAAKRNVEKLLEDSKQSTELWEREETKRRVKVEDELKESRTRVALLETQTLPQLEHQLEDARRELGELRLQKEEDRELVARKLDLTAKRAVERERQQWEEASAAKFQLAAEQVDELKIALSRAEQLASRQTKEMDDMRRLLDSTKLDCERQLQQIEYDLEAKLTMEQNTKRALQQDFDDLKRSSAMLEEEMQLERTRVNQKIDLAVIKHTERVRQEQRNQVDFSQKQLDLERKQVLRELEEAKIAEIRWKQSVEELTVQVDRLQLDKDGLMARNQEAVQIYEFERQQMENEKKHWEQSIRALEDEFANKWQEETALVHQLEEARGQNLELRAKRSNTCNGKTTCYGRWTWFSARPRTTI